MNTGLLYHTLLRFTRWEKLLNLAFYVLVLPIAFGIFSKSVSTHITLNELLSGPAIPMLVAYGLVKSEIGNSKSLNDGEYLSLIFTRPVSRANYVISKWLICSTIVSLIVLTQQLIFRWTAETVWHMNAESWNTLVFVTNAICNSFGVTAVIVLVNSFPPKIGMVLLLLISYLTGFTALWSESALAVEKETTAAACWVAVLNASHFLRTFLNPSMDAFNLITSGTGDLQPLIIYLSNVCIYLTIAVVILSRREFFYASE